MVSGKGAGAFFWERLVSLSVLLLESWKRAPWGLLGAELWERAPPEGGHLVKGKNCFCTMGVRALPSAVVIGESESVLSVLTFER
jgi:hypothetical protein